MKKDITLQDHKDKSISHIINIATALGLIACIAFIIYGIQQQIFTSEKALNDFLLQLGIFAPIVFVLIQAVQVVIPIIPGSIGCLAGVIFFGPLWGFFYNYIGICTGSVIAFLLARKFGQSFVQSIASKKNWDKYFSWLQAGTSYERLFIGAILFPVAPDDFLCYLSGLTHMKFRKYLMIILLAKPFSIAIYTFLLGAIFDFIIKLVG